MPAGPLDKDSAARSNRMGLGGTATVEQYTVGTLVVDLYDAETR